MGIAPIRPGMDVTSPVQSPPQLYSVPTSPANSLPPLSSEGPLPTSYAPHMGHPAPPMHGQYVPPPPTSGFSHAPTGTVGPPPLMGFVRTSTH